MKQWIVIVLMLAACKGSKGTEQRDDASAGPGDGGAGKDVVTLFRAVIENRYSHRDQRGVDWDAAFAEHRAALEAAKTPAAFATVAAALLAKAKDTHISITVDGAAKPIYTYPAPLDFNFDLSIIATRIEGIRDIDPCVAVGKADKKTGYLLLKSFVSGNCPSFGASFEAAWAEVGTPSRLIIDARPNTGGDENLARMVAARFIEGDLVYALSELGPPKAGLERYPRRLMGSTETQRYRGETRVLIGGGNLSSTEGFLLMMRLGPKVKFVGATTYGSSGNPKPIALGNGVTINLPSWRTIDPQGNPLEGRGIAPDIAVAWPGANPKVDPVLEAALVNF